jgi:hypothetical protein
VHSNNEHIPTSYYSETDAAYNKAARTPIQVGGMIEGPIQFEIENFDVRIIDENSEFILSVADVWGNIYSTRTTLKELNAQPPQMFPTLPRRENKLDKH